MKQLLLRVPEDVHARLSARAAHEGRSINAIATEMLDTAVDVVEGDPKSVIRARAAALGLLRSPSADRKLETQGPSRPSRQLPAGRADIDRATVLELLRGITTTATDLIDDQRGPR
jgi:plasmid stability protein